MSRGESGSYVVAVAVRLIGAVPVVMVVAVVGPAILRPGGCRQQDLREECSRQEKGGSWWSGARSCVVPYRRRINPALLQRNFDERNELNGEKLMMLMKDPLCRLLSGEKGQKWWYKRCVVNVGLTEKANVSLLWPVGDVSFGKCRPVMELSTGTRRDTVLMTCGCVYNLVRKCGGIYRRNILV